MVLVLVGFGNIAAGISVCVSSDLFTWYNGSYIFLGFTLVLIAIFGHTTRSALGGLTFYLILLLLTFLTESGFTIAIILYTEYESILGEEYANLIRWLMIGACVLMLLSVVVGFCYRSSLKDAQFYKNNEKLVHPTDEPVARPSIRREEMEKKYNLTRKNTEGKE
jgi:glucan phosphoethanolaminetransferase (alkaline phosphatase superfamily)